MAISYVGSAVGPASTGAGPFTVNLPAAAAAGNMLALVVLTKAAAPPTVNDITGWTKPTDYTVTGGAGAQGDTGGNVRMSVLFREFQTGDTAPSVSLSASSSPYQSLMFAWSRTESAWADPACVTAADTTGSATGYDPPTASPLALATGDVLGIATSLNDNEGTPGTPTLSAAGVTFGTLTSRGGGATGLGNDARIACHDAPVNAGTATDGPDFAWPFTGAVSDFAGCSVFFRLREASATPVDAISETDALLASQRTSSKTTGSVAEADTLAAASRTHSATVGTTGETDNLAPVARTSIRTVGVLAEDDALASAIRSTSRQAGILTEGDALATPAKASSRQTGLLTETDALLAIHETSEVGAIGETDQLLPVSHATAHVTGPLAEADSLVAAIRSTTRLSGVLGEADSLVTAGRSSSKTTSVLVELDALAGVGEEVTWTLRFVTRTRPRVAAATTAKPTVDMEMKA